MTNLLGGVKPLHFLNYLKQDGDTECLGPRRGWLTGLASTALVLSIAVPFGGNWWYAMTLLSPLAGVYYLQKGTRDEEFAVGPASVPYPHFPHDSSCPHFP